LLRWRLFSAAVILTVVLALFWLDFRQVLFHTPGTWLLPLLLVVAALATEELLSLMRAKDVMPVAAPVYVGNIAIPLAAGLPIVMGALGYADRGPARGEFGTFTLAVVAVCAALAFVAEMMRYKQPGQAMVRSATSVLALVYIGVLISFWGLLRLHVNNGWGMAALFSMLLVVKMADTGAFATGKLLGRHKMTPILSPGKTWEGTIGGLTIASLTSWLFFRFGAGLIVGEGYVEPAAWASLLYGLLIAVAGMAGDLIESMLKRDAGQKDSSTWLRGLGGVLDIIDAPLVAGPIAWLCWTLALVGPRL
jgi:phosphatidate cytidylyltransferase